MKVYYVDGSGILHSAECEKDIGSITLLEDSPVFGKKGDLLRTGGEISLSVETAKRHRIEFVTRGLNSYMGSFAQLQVILNKIKAIKSE